MSRLIRPRVLTTEEFDNLPWWDQAINKNGWTQLGFAGICGTVAVIAAVILI